MLNLRLGCLSRRKAVPLRDLNSLFACRLLSRVPGALRQICLVFAKLLE